MLTQYCYGVYGKMFAFFNTLALLYSLYFVYFKFCADFESLHSIREAGIDIQNSMDGFILKHKYTKI